MPESEAPIGKRNPAWKDTTRNARTQQREEKIKAACWELGFKNKSALLTALINNEIEIVKAKHE